MAGLRFSLVHNTPEIAKKIVAAPQFMAEDLDKAFARIAIELARAERAAAPKFRGELTNSIGTERVGLLQHVIAARGKAYGPYVDEGTGPGGRPPLEEIRAWIKLKGIRPRRADLTPDSLARLIRRTIAQRGVRAQNFWMPTFEALLPRADVLLNEAVDRALTRAAQA